FPYTSLFRSFALFIDLGGGLFGLVGEPLEDMLRADFFGPLQPERADQLAEALDRRGVIVGHMLLAVGDVDGAGADRVLRRNARRAGVVVTAQRLDAANRKHHRPRDVAHISAERDLFQHVKAGDDLAARDDADVTPMADADKAVMHEDERLVERHAKTVGIFDGRGAGAALRPVNGDKIGQDAGFQHRLADAHKLAPPTDAELEADRLAARQLAQAGDEFEQPLRRREGAVRRWREHVLADGNAADARDFLIHLDA